MNKNVRYINKIFFLLGESKDKIPWLLFLFILLSLLDLVGLGLIFSYISLIVDKESFIQSEIYSLISHNNHTYIGLDSLYIVIGAILLFVFLVKTVASILINKSIVDFSYRKGVDIRSQLMSLYQYLPYSEFLQRNSSEYIYNIQVLAATFSHGVLLTILRMTSVSIVGLVVLIFLAWTNIYALTLLIMLVGIYAISYNKIFHEKLQKYGRLNNGHNVLMVQGINEAVDGLKEIRVLGKEKYFYNVMRNSAKSSAKLSAKSSIINTLPNFTTEFLMILFVTLVVIVSTLLEQDPRAVIPILSMFGVAAVRLIPSANMVISGVSQINFTRDAINILYDDLINLKPSKKNREFTLNLSNFHSFELKNVEFTYQHTVTPAINNISLTIKEGDAIGFIGTSGSGKTTLIDIILGLLKIDKGEIVLNGNTLESEEDFYSWKSKIAYLPQEIFLIDDTLEQNIALGVEKEGVDKKQIRMALKQAKLIDFVEQLPLGVETILGERGVRLSGGQRQRVALARAFYHGRNVLIMDEATSSLDNETEKEIIDEIKRLKGSTTMIIIAHRYTTIEHCDLIYKIDNGKIVESGSFNSIVNRKNRK
jgi:ABC-type bacteriocin/lantibiotic exporter with double-glycine peptidase domain